LRQEGKTTGPNVTRKSDFESEQPATRAERGGEFGESYQVPRLAAPKTMVLVPDGGGEEIALSPESAVSVN
jgi:hypothetical protein